MSDVHVSDPNTIPSEDHVDDPLLTIENVTEWRATADVFDAFFTRQIASIYCHVTADRGIPLPDRDTGAVDGWEAVKTEADELRNCWLRTWYESEELGFGKENPSRPQELAAAITALRQAAIRNHDAMEEIYSSLERYVHGTDSLAADEFSTAFHQYVKDGYDPVSTLNSLSFTDKTAASLLQSISDCHSRLEDFREAVRLTVSP
ncbi:hypothetical protein M231_03129 [Tremella mesenterica]|uniref:Uncharacterized protein n=1 Tax=Tremella mesenterica TaxID=5217 RepID=A0A4V1M499_TREME|nr:hypothetical protein M231_03129 [Tremella mesenterica]